MKFIAVLSKEHPQLPFEELLSVLRADAGNFRVLERFGDRGVLFESERMDFSRLAYTMEVSEIVKGPSETVEDMGPVEGFPGSFCVRAIGLGEDIKDMDKLESTAGSVLDTEERDVDLEEPEYFFRLFSTSEGYFLGRRVFRNDGGSFEDRRSHLRPFSSPVSLHPKLARCLVNLSEVCKGGSVVDPFCGTGGILLEAGMMGMEVRGCDIDEVMVEGCTENLDFYGVEEYEIMEEDAFSFLEWLEPGVDAVVTDLPYGKSSLKFSDTDEMVERLLESVEDNCVGKLVFMLDRESVAGLQSDFEVYVHRSLSRYIYRVVPKQLNIDEE